MCKAFVKLPRPFGDQTGGARKWGIRAGCEGWFAGGGYHPPSNAVTSNKPNKNRKAKSTAHSKLLAVGMSSGKKLPPGFPSPTSSDGPSSGPAYDGSSGAVAPYQQPYSAAAFSSPATNSHLTPGYHYIPVNSSQNYTQPQPIYVPVWTLDLSTRVTLITDLKVLKHGVDKWLGHKAATARPWIPVSMRSKFCRQWVLLQAQFTLSANPSVARMATRQRYCDELAVGISLTTLTTVTRRAGRSCSRLSWL